MKTLTRFVLIPTLLIASLLMGCGDIDLNSHRSVVEEEVEPATVRGVVRLESGEVLEGAPVWLTYRSNGGCLLIDDFGRQRIEPQELLNRWIVPLESRVDYLKLASGKKIQVPFEQLIIFSTNLEPSDLVDDAFLRRIPYKIEISDPSAKEFHVLFQIYSDRM